MRFFNQHRIEVPHLRHVSLMRGRTVSQQALSFGFRFRLTPICAYMFLPGESLLGLLCFIYETQTGIEAFLRAAFRLRYLV